ncbi:hypothetical protein HHI36_012005 [Cryptolaemus montrouzieri]|uniref:Peptidase S1 domain-containing protein n=1 Tax=Cryptolaemus montrouzieri TaxID=559131 RepID=A0ABD2NCZ8_9CUCU
MLKSILFLSGFILLTHESSILHRHIRIVGGREADIKEFPYQVSVVVNGLHLCGGSIISEKYVITAAQCIDGETTQNVEVCVGSSTIGAQEGKMYKIKAIFENQDFSFWNYDSDIAILELAEDLTFGSTVGNIGLPAKGDDVPLPGSMGVITGWGVTVERTTNLSTQLLTTQVPIMSLYQCINDYSADKITQNMICAGYNNGQYDSCFGDSGGPLVVGDVLVGIVSWGYACGEKNKPGVYTSVIGMRDFIESITGL